MNINQLINLAEKNEIRVSNRGKTKRIPEYYYDSLRHAFSYYFNTFQTQSRFYEEYSMGMSYVYNRKLNDQYLDQDNTVLTIIAFERFFELFLKDLLRKTSPKLTYTHSKTGNGNRAKALISKIRDNTFKPKKHNNKYLSATFRDSLDRFYGLIELEKESDPDPIVKKFRRIINQYSFLDSKQYQTTLHLLSWYRDRILHNGNKLPSLWFLDYMISQRIIPIVQQIIEARKGELGKSMFYLKTVTGIDLLDHITRIQFDFKDLRQKKEQHRNFVLLLYLGHLKELGRANLNMNLYTRNNKATYELNYNDVNGRGMRFANAEKLHPDFKRILGCPCCGLDSLVHYRHSMDDFFHEGEIINIDWVKCYTCDYYIRYNVGDPHFFELSQEEIFTLL
ncbi:MAG: hypothetical protein QE487_16005 [Fluviicola sp.]|nr:hypothetical protein [Fluviicola sp.]